MLTVKIRRNGHMFWIDGIRRLEDGVYIGRVANEGVPDFPLGAPISFVDFEGHTEVCEATSHDIYPSGVKH